ncbi:MAG: hypothetical protein Q8O24_09190, partial [Gallionellaceae bacterium]|nr:hypothetical protein [Gallionellaceae bacterium]
MPIWATHLKLKEGELLSSWIIRLSSECGMTAEQFCKAALSIKRPNLSSMLLVTSQLAPTISILQSDHSS